MAGAQVKSGDRTNPGKYFREAKRDPQGEVVGWWYRESTRKHFDYWVNHRTPHSPSPPRSRLSGVVLGAHHPRARDVPKRAQKSSCLRVRGLTRLRRHPCSRWASTQRLDTWEGSSWNGASNLSPTDMYRHALLVPRLVAPHPNRSVAKLDQLKAVALLVLGRQPRLRSTGNTEVNLAQVDASYPWEWQLAAGLRSFIRRSQTSGLEAALQAASHPHEQTVSTVALAAVYFENDDIPAATAVLEALLHRDVVEAVDHAWLSLHLARAQYEVGDLSTARDESLKLDRAERDGVAGSDGYSDQRRRREPSVRGF